MPRASSPQEPCPQPTVRDHRRIEAEDGEVEDHERGEDAAEERVDERRR